MQDIGAYRVTEQLGSGALATVYKAVQEPLGRVVALKVLKSTIGPSSPFAAQLEREARVLGDLGHPNVVLLYDFVKSEREMYLVLEHLDGWSLADVLKKAEARKRRLPYEATAAALCQIARALAHAHERGVVHRDLKPQNLLVSKRGEIKLCDFGIAQREKLPSADIPFSPQDGPPAGDHAAFGTPAYMSPEQILGEQVDARSDLFSLGVVLYQLLAGHRPFDATAAKERDKDRPSQRIRRDPPPPIRTRAPDVPRALEKIAMRLLEKHPDDRYASADEVAALLEDVVRAKTRESVAHVVARALGELGIAPAKRGAPPAPLATLAPKSDLTRTIGGLAAIGAVFVAGAIVVQTTSPPRADARALAAPLPLAPKDGGALHVVASPWAEVSVDGQYVDTTPFARAIPVGAGTHWVTLRHPNAPEEKREVAIRAGETVLVDVTMKVEGGP
jgi:serine/threonine-protein kinase